MVRPASDSLDLGNPIDLLEELVCANDWSFDRASDSELAVQIAGQWGDYQMWFAWQEELYAVYFACHVEARTPQAKRRAARELVVLANERLWLGHFDLVGEEGTLLFRHTMPLRGTRGASVEQLEDLVDTAVAECDRFYPALQLVVWGGHSAPEAMTAAMMETIGEA